MRKAILAASLLLLGSAILGATVFREPIARAAGLAPGAPVLVTNTPAQAVPVTVQPRPFQVIWAGGSGDPTDCTTAPLTPGRPFVLEALAVHFGAAVPLDVILRVREQAEPNVTFFYPLYAINLDANGFADKLLQLHVRPNVTANSVRGDIIGVAVCWTNPAPPSLVAVSAALSGHYE